MTEEKKNGRTTINGQVWRWVERAGWLMILILTIFINMSSLNKKDALIELSIPALELKIDDLKNDFRLKEIKDEKRWEEADRFDAAVAAYIKLNSE